MNIREASYLLEIEKTQQITKAAKNLYITQPALSKAIKKIEMEMGCQLFYRDGSLLLPTEYGLIVLKTAQSITAEYEKCIEEIRCQKEMEHSQINLGLPIGAPFLVSPMIAQFSREYPFVKINANVFGGNYLIHLLRTSKLDVAFLMPIQKEDEEGLVVQKQLYKSEMAVGVNPTHPWAEKQYICDEDFENAPFVTLDSTTQSHSLLVSRLRSSGIEPVLKMQSNDFPWLIEYAKAMNLPCFMSEVVMRYYAGNSLLIKRFRPSIAWGMDIVIPMEKKSSRATRLFLQFVQEYLKDNPLEGEY